MHFVLPLSEILAIQQGEYCQLSLLSNPWRLRQNNPADKACVQYTFSSFDGRNSDGGQNDGGFFEPTCAHARWALMHRFASVCPSLDQNSSLEINSYIKKYYRQGSETSPQYRLSLCTLKKNTNYTLRKNKLVSVVDMFQNDQKLIHISKSIIDRGLKLHHSVDCPHGNSRKIQATLSEKKTSSAWQMCFKMHQKYAICPLTLLF